MAPHQYGSTDNALETSEDRDWVGLWGACGREMAERRWRGGGQGDGGGGGVTNIWGKREETVKSGLKSVLLEDTVDQSKGYIGVRRESI